MAIVLDIFGVVYGVDGFNNDLFALTDKKRALGEKIYLASNVDSRKLAILTQDFGLSHHIDGLFCSSDLKVAKPDREFYHQVTRRISVMPDEIIFFDDSMTNVNGAQAYGWHGHLYMGIQDTEEKIALFMKNQGR